MILPVLRVLAGISGRTLGTALSYGLRVLCPASDARVRAAERGVAVGRGLQEFANGERVSSDWLYDDDPIADCEVPEGLSCPGNHEGCDGSMEDCYGCDDHGQLTREGRQTFAACSLADEEAREEAQVRADGFSLRDLSVLGNAATGIEMWAAGKPCGWAAPWLRVADAVRALQASVAPDTRLPGSDAATGGPALEPPPATGAGQPIPEAVIAADVPPLYAQIGEQRLRKFFDARRRQPRQVIGPARRTPHEASPPRKEPKSR